MSPAPILVLPPIKWEFSQEKKIQTQITKLGDGYGLMSIVPNSARITTEIVIPNLSTANKNEIVSLFKAYGGITRFRWRPLETLTYKEYICDKWSVIQQGTYLWQISATFAEQKTDGTDTDAQAYITAVEAADGAALEEGVKTAINNFVVGCKADGIWNAIKASCILAGARTLAGALVPLRGTAPTNFNFVSGDYNRKTGLKGNGSNKNLLSNYTLLASNSSNSHASVYPTESLSLNSEYIGGSGSGGNSNGLTSVYVWFSFAGVYYGSWNENNYLGPAVTVNALLGISRSSAVQFVARGGKSQSTIVQALVVSPVNHGIRVFTRNVNGTAANFATSARIAFYSIGESLDLALLDARVTTLIDAYSTAIV